MKDQEFIELLNLYLDHEISEADAARLEAEVQRNAARYRIYREYCQMHKACTLLSPAHVGEVPAVATFEAPSRRWANPFAVGGLMAAAAAVAFVFVQRAHTPAPESAGAAVLAATQVAPAVESVVTQTPSATAPRSIGQTITTPVLLGRADRAAVATTQTLRWNTEDVAAPAVQDARFNWLETLQLTSVSEVPTDSLRFEAKSAPKDAQRGFGLGQPESANEYNAFQFRR